MKLTLHGTEQKAVVHTAGERTAGPGRALQQGSSSTTPQAAGGSLAADGKNSGKMPKVRQQSAVQDGSRVGQQQNRGFSLKSLFGWKKSAATSAPPAAVAAQHKGTTLRDLLMADRAAEQETEALPAAAHLTRSGGVRRQSLQDMVGRPVSTAAQPAGEHQQTGARLGITLNNGKLQLAAGNPPAVNTLLMQTLGKADQHYLAHHASDDGRQHLLLDRQGRLFDVKSDATGHSVLHNSQSATLRGQLAQAGETPLRLGVKPDNQQITLDAHALMLSQPGDAHRAMLSGIWQAAGQAVCLHNDKIHTLDAQTGVWQAAGDTTHSQLARQADGKLYALQDGHALHNLSDHQTSATSADKIRSFTVGERGEVALLSDSDHTISLMPGLTAAPESHLRFSLQQPDRVGAALEPQSLALSHGQLFVADSEHRIHSGSLADIADGKLTMQPLAQIQLQQHFGDDHQIGGFFTDDGGSLNALVKDNTRQQHACPLGNDKQFHPGWNLSDALTVSNQLGLQQVTPEPHQIFDMAHGGSLTLQQGTLHYFDHLTRSWSPAESGCQQLKKGLDGAAWILKQGEVKRLDINQSSAAISQGENNVFSLPHVRNKPEAGSALPGPGTAGKTQAMAVIGASHWLALSDSGEIHSVQIKPGSRQLAQPAQTLSREGISGSLKDIHLDAQHNLYAVNQEGEIFHQTRAQWQHGEAGSGWQKLALPTADSPLQHLQMDAEHQPRAILADGSQYQLKQGEWHPHHAARPEPLTVPARASQAVFDRLQQGVKGRRIPSTGITLQATAQVAGHSGMESRKVSSKFADRVRAYVFNPTLGTPRPLKNAAYHTQHSWQGRQGLRPLYEMQGALIKQLEAHNVRNSDIQPDLHSKLAALDLGEHGGALLKDLRHFCDALDQSATRALTQLGQHQGAIHSNGVVNEGFQPSRSKAIVQGMNVNRSGHDLSKTLEQAVRTTPVSPRSQLQPLLSTFVRLGVNMSHQKSEVPLGRQRDPNDKMALTKSRLILDTLTLAKLHQLVDQAVLVSGHQPDAGQIKQLRQQFAALRDGEYGGNPVKHYTDMGFTHNGALEAGYDAAKAFINAFKKEHHGVNLTARTVLGTQGNGELEKKLSQTLLSLDSGESVSFSRAYGGGLSTAFAPALNKVPVPVVPGAGVTLDRAYNLSFSRTSGGLNVSFGRDGGVTGSVSVSTGHDLLPYMTGAQSSAGNASDWLSKKHKISPDFRIGAGISASLQGTRQNSLSFKLTDAELPGFIHGLTHGTLTPTELMQKGTEHQMKQGSKLVFSVDTTAALDLRAGINITKDGSKPNSVTARASVGVNASLNLISGRQEHSLKTGQSGSTEASSDNRLTVLNAASAGANATLTAGVGHAFMRDGKSAGTLPAFTSTNVAVALAMDNRTSQSISVELKHAEPVTAAETDEIITTLGKHFKDRATTLMLADMKKQTTSTPAKQLEALHNHFNDRQVSGDDRYEALRSLQKLVLRQQSAEANRPELGSASHSTSYNNLSRLDNSGFFGLLQQHFTASLPPDSATRLSGLMEKDPLLKGLIKQLQTTPFSTASVTMELKDGLRDDTEKAMLAGKIGREELGVLFQDRNNLRIKSIAVSQNVSSKEGFTAPALLLGGSNSAAMSMERNIGTINFKYGRDQEQPRRFTLEGEIARANPALATALAELRKEGFEIKS